MLEKEQFQASFMNLIRDFFRTVKGIGTLGLVLVGLRGAEPTAFAMQSANHSEEEVGYLNLPIKTLGGRQYWTDVRFLDGWKIQHNAATGHFRLLDPQDVRRAWGNRAHCEKFLNETAQEQGLKPPAGRVVVLMHGLIRSSESMRSIRKHLASQIEATFVDLEYASCHRSIEEHAQALHEVIRGLGSDVTRIDFVCHSMGNIVVRHYLADLKKHGEESKPPFGRMVMLAPPNQGSRMAKIMSESSVFSAFTGVSGFQLGRGWEEFSQSLATPDFEFAVIAGVLAESVVANNVLLGDSNDLLVEIDETRLVGASDTSEVETYHAGLLTDDEVLRQVTSFLEHGYLLAPERRQPWPPTARER